MTDLFDPESLDADSTDSGMLLFALAAMPVEPAGPLRWVQRRRHVCASVISREEDVSDATATCWRACPTRMPPTSIATGNRCCPLRR
jgi:hypothetical protein